MFLKDQFNGLFKLTVERLNYCKKNQAAKMFIYYFILKEFKRLFIDFFFKKYYIVKTILLF